MSINIPTRRRVSLFEDPDLDERYAREMQRYREAITTGHPYSPEAALFGAGEPRSRARVGSGLAPAETDNGLPDSVPEREADPSDNQTTSPGMHGMSIYEVLPPGTVLSDAQPDGVQAGDQLANKKILTGHKGVAFRAYYKNDAGGHGGRQEHARRGPGGEYHFHLYDKNGNAGPRISSESFQPLPGDEHLFTGNFKTAIESLTDAEKRYLYKANREVFHTGNVPWKLIEKLTLEKTLSRGIVPPPMPRQE